MLQACLNGARRPEEAPGAPMTPEALARDARDVRAAGADALHLHPRDATGAQSLAPQDIAVALRAVRAAVPGMPVGIGTGDDIPPGGPARQEHLRAWRDLPEDARPDYASVNLIEPDAFDVMALLASSGVRIEAGLWTLEDAERLLRAKDAPAPLRILIETTVDDPQEARARADAILARLADARIAAPVLLHGLDGSAWPMLAYAAELGLARRIGFEDVMLLPNGAPAVSNAELITAACALASPS